MMISAFLNSEIKTLTVAVTQRITGAIQVRRLFKVHVEWNVHLYELFATEYDIVTAEKSLHNLQ